MEIEPSHVICDVFLIQKTYSKMTSKRIAMTTRLLSHLVQVTLQSTVTVVGGGGGLFLTSCATLCLSVAAGYLTWTFRILQSRILRVWVWKLFKCPFWKRSPEYLEMFILHFRFSRQWQDRTFRVRISKGEKGSADIEQGTESNALWFRGLARLRFLLFESTFTVFLLSLRSSLSFRQAISHCLRSETVHKSLLVTFQTKNKQLREENLALKEKVFSVILVRCRVCLSSNSHRTRQTKWDGKMWKSCCSWRNIIQNNCGRVCRHLMKTMKTRR